MEEYTRL